MTTQPPDTPGSNPDGSNIETPVGTTPPAKPDTVTPGTPAKLPIVPMPFALIAFGAAALIALIALLVTFKVVGKHVNDDLSHQLTVPLIICGVLLVTFGAAMASVDWRAGYESASGGPRGVGEDASKVIDALGKLKGAALILVSGLVLLLGLAWIAASAATGAADEAPKTPPTSNSSTPSPAATP